MNNLFMQQGGLCYTHGPYKNGFPCPEMPSCGQGSRKSKYIKQGLYLDTRTIELLERVLRNEVIDEILAFIKNRETYPDGYSTNDEAAFNRLTDDITNLKELI